MKRFLIPATRTFGFLTAALLGTSAYGQDLPQAEVERLSRQPAVVRAEDGRELPTPERSFRGPNVVPNRLLVTFRPGSIRLHQPTDRLRLASLSDAALAEVMPSAALRALLRAEGVRELRQVFTNARSGERQRMRVDEWEVELPDLSNHIVLELPEHADLEAVARHLEQISEVVHVEADRYVSTHEFVSRRFGTWSRPAIAPWLAAPSDPYYSLQHGLEQPNDVDIDAEAAWGVQTSTPSVRIGIIDTGVDYNPY